MLPTHTSELFHQAVEHASALLRAGQAVALPTETVYGLAANALDVRAVARLFAIKGRPPENPIIVHVAEVAMARRCADHWPALADRLAAAFWPGPLTLVVPRADDIPDLVTAGGPTVGVRWPSHPFMQAVIRACGFPLAAPSANPSGRVSPTTAEHVRRDLGRSIPLIVDGGPAQVGLESTVLDLTVSPPRVLRPGMIHVTALEAVTGRLASTRADAEVALKSPGLLSKHYAPRAQLFVWAWNNEAELRAQLTARHLDLDRTQVIAHHVIPSSLAAEQVNVVPHDPAAFARALYAALRRCDDHGARWIVLEAVPRTEEWQAIADRLQRAVG